MPPAAERASRFSLADLRPPVDRQLVVRRKEPERHARQRGTAGAVRVASRCLGRLPGEIASIGKLVQERDVRLGSGRRTPPGGHVRMDGRQRKVKGEPRPADLPVPFLARSSGGRLGRPGGGESTDQGRQHGRDDDQPNQGEQDNQDERR